jgi:AcrR family transcriptional regulator
VTSTDPKPVAPSRRAANRLATVTAIKAAALRQVAEEGAPALSIRGVAREVGLSPAGMYRYYDGRDALLTDLLVDAYRDLGDAVRLAAGLPQVDDPIAALLRAIEAYRAWAVAHPARFLLIFGTPVPGYAAPPDGPTVAANRAMGEVFLTLAALAWRDGRIARPEPAGSYAASPAEVAVVEQLEPIAPGFPAALVPRMLAGWAQWHGLVTLEVTGQLHWIYPDTAAYFTGRMRAWVGAFASGAA